MQVLKEKLEQMNADFYEVAEFGSNSRKSLSGKWFMADAIQRKRILSFIGSNFTIKDKAIKSELREPFASMRQNSPLFEMVEPERRLSNLLSFFARYSKEIRQAKKALCA